MQIHHTKVREALQMGCYISVTADGRIRVFWPQHNVELFAATVDEALLNMHMLQTQVESGNGQPQATNNDPTHINGVAKDGKVAYKEGTPAADCPYLEESDDFARWNEDWDTAADEASAEETKEAKVGSVVTNRYRAQYSEMGHPTHCGDELAVLLNAICQNKAGTNLEMFTAICAANGVDLTRYKSNSKGWQGRLRMTGRNLLSKKVYEQHGRLNMPFGYAPEFYQLTEDWLMSVKIKFKPKADR